MLTARGYFQCRISRPGRVFLEPTGHGDARDGKYQGGGATMGTEAFAPGTNDEGWAGRDTDGDDFIQLPCIGRGTQEAAIR
ncbi:hypothetical protein NDU88_006037 [Pleurodeles waltl]|uniref:Uncharacterized protein n=1 Tax=Pleurodeles waltl TaxID=8319 RepID=A0AAV7TVZ5_PLEWA|nr:hypothetical protein NDU88_006037 [Pleurodeles waltl]